MLLNMGFGRREIEVLLSVNLADIHRLGGLTGHPLSIALDRRAFALMVDHLKHERENEETIRQLIQQDAPHPMLETLFGMSVAEYAGWRQALQIRSPVGRPPVPDRETTHKVWAEWRRVLGDRGSDSITAREYAELGLACDVSLRLVWPVIQRSGCFRDPPAADTKPPATADTDGDGDNVISLPGKKTFRSRQG